MSLLTQRVLVRRELADSRPDGPDKPQHYSLKVFPLTTSTQLNLRRNVARSFEPVTQLQIGDMGNMLMIPPPFGCMKRANKGIVYISTGVGFLPTNRYVLRFSLLQKKASKSLMDRQNRRFDLFAPK